MYHMLLGSIFISAVLSARVRLTQAQREGQPKPWSLSNGLPTQITATLPGWNLHRAPTGNYTFPNSITIHTALKASTHLESLNLRITLLGCSNHPDRRSLPFALEGGDKYPRIDNLCLEGYSFWDSEYQHVMHPEGFPVWDSYPYEWFDWFWYGKARKWWNWRKMPKEQYMKTNAELWADAMDWSLLKSLDLRSLDGEDFVKHISPSLVELQELTLHNFRLCNISEWIVTLPPLKKLVWLGGCDTKQTTFDGLLLRHGMMLEELHIHPLRINSRSPFMTTPQIKLIGQMAPNLKRLAVAIKRNGTWPMEVIEAIAKVPKLEVVELWMEYVNEEAYGDGQQLEYDFLGSSRYDRTVYQEPHLNHEAVMTLWKLMKEQSHDRLQRVSFHAGDFTKSWDGPVYSRGRFEGYRKAWLCDDQGCRKIDRELDVFEKQKDIDYERESRVEQQEEGIEDYIEEWEDDFGDDDDNDDS